MEIAGKILVRTLLDVAIQNLVEFLIPELDWALMLKILAFMLVCKYCVQTLGCLSVVILMVWFLLA